MIAVGSICLAMGPVAFTAETQAEVDSFLPQAVSAQSYTELKSLSPFRRSIDLSASLVLTGMATIEGRIYATLFDSTSTTSHVVSERANANGWQLVDVRGSETDLESLTAKIQVEGGEVVSIRYAKVEFKRQQAVGPSGNSGTANGSLSQEQIEDARLAGRDPGRGFRGDGYRGPPPPELMEKLKKITPQQREQLARRVMQMRNNGVSSDERRRIYVEALDRAARGR